MNSTEIDNPRTWATYSVCEIMADRSRYGQPIRCVAIHPAYDNPTMSSSTEVRFDVRCEYIYIYLFFAFYFDLLQINRFDRLLSIYRQRSGMFVSSLLKIDFFFFRKDL